MRRHHIVGSCIFYRFCQSLFFLLACLIHSLITDKEGLISVIGLFVFYVPYIAFSSLISCIAVFSSVHFFFCSEMFKFLSCIFCSYCVCAYLGDYIWHPKVTTLIWIYTSLTLAAEKTALLSLHSPTFDLLISQNDIFIHCVPKNINW